MSMSREPVIIFKKRPASETFQEQKSNRATAAKIDIYLDPRFHCACEYRPLVTWYLAIGLTKRIVAVPGLYICYHCERFYWRKGISWHADMEWYEHEPANGIAFDYIKFYYATEFAARYIVKYAIMQGHVVPCSPQTVKLL